MDVSVKMILCLTFLTLQALRINAQSLLPGPDYVKKAESAVTSSADHVVETFHVTADIRYRFATTTMVSLVRNTAAQAQEVTFDVILPKEAFIMHFAMTIDNKTYDGEVKEKKAAKEQYQAAVDRGQSAGHVRQKARHANVFEVSVNVASGKAVNFTLTYQELLRRRRGVYEYELHVQPGQPVEDFLVEVNIKERQPLKYVRTPSLRTDELITNEVEEENAFALIDQSSPETAKVLYKPSLKDQGEGGVKGQFVVQYDVQHPKAGDLLVVDGYFVHFFSPKLPPMPKDIIFVLDLSGSMSGTKLKQLKKAMETILSDIQEHDRFNIITFSSGVTKWKPGLVSASDRSNIQKATEFVNGMAATGMTNINLALTTAVETFYKIEQENHASIIFFLTDGQPTEGEEDPKQIARNIQKANEKKVAILSLAFGKGADFEALKTISAQNSGFARKIYEASDAALQVSSLYSEISSVVMKNLSVSYLPSQVDEFTLTENNFPIVYNGTEVVICGYMPRAEGRFAAKITGQGRQGEPGSLKNDLEWSNSGEIDLTFETNDVTKFVIEEEEVIIDITDVKEGGTKIGKDSESRDFAGLLERMWAFVTIKQLIRDREKNADNQQMSDQLKKKIIDLSLKYKLVTPLTSMVVTKPDTEKESQVSLEDADSTDNKRNFGVPVSHAYSVMTHQRRKLGVLPNRAHITGHTAYLTPPLYYDSDDDAFDPSVPYKRRDPVPQPKPTPVSGRWQSHGKQSSKPCATPLVNCIMDPCRNAMCPAFPTAECRSNYCGGCNYEFWENGKEVTSLCSKPQIGGRQSSKPCKTQTVACFVDPCSNAVCSAYPDAECRSNYCGGCNHEFWLGQKEVTSKCNKKKNKSKSGSKSKGTKESVLTALLVEEKSKTGCAVMKKIPAGRYTLIDQVKGQPIKVTLNTYCPKSKCRKVGITSLDIQDISINAKEAYRVSFNASNPNWIHSGPSISIKKDSGPSISIIKEKKRKLVLKTAHMSIIVKKSQSKKYDKYVILFQVKDSMAYSGLLDAVLDNNSKNPQRSKKNKKNKKNIRGWCKRVKSDVSKILKANDAKMYNVNVI